MIPEKIQRLFWDVEKKTVDFQKHRPYIVRRIMDCGNMKDVEWMLVTYSPEEIVEVVRKSRRLSRKSAYFWSTYFKIPQEEILCLKMSSQRG